MNTFNVWLTIDLTTAINAEFGTTTEIRMKCLLYRANIFLKINEDQKAIDDLKSIQPLTVEARLLLGYQVSLHILDKIYLSVVVLQVALINVEENSKVQKTS